MTPRRNRSPSGSWALSYLIPFGAAFLAWKATGSVTAGVVATVVAFVLFVIAAARR
jgi:hypothetical protein